ncbi:MAG: hypothetical protein AAGF24_16300 [Cyanobacteria bacterium P01_H01_bin.121]
MLSLQQTDSKLRLRHFPLQVWSICSVLVLAGGAVIWSLGRVTTLNCDRFLLREGTCQLRQIRVLGEQTQTLPLEDIYRADTDWESRIVLQTRQRDFILTGLYGDSGLTRQFITKQINHFLDNPYTIRLALRDDGRPFAYTFGTIFIISGIAIAILFGGIVVYEADLNQRTLTLKQHKLWGCRVHEYQLDSLQHIDLAQAEQQDPRQRCHLSLQLRSGDRILFSPAHGLSRQAAATTIQHLQHCLAGEAIDYGHFSL